MVTDDTTLAAGARGSQETDSGVAAASCSQPLAGAGPALSQKLAAAEMVEEPLTVPAAQAMEARFEALEVSRAPPPAGPPLAGPGPEVSQKAAHVCEAAVSCIDSVAAAGPALSQKLEAPEVVEKLPTVPATEAEPMQNAAPVFEAKETTQSFKLPEIFQEEEVDWDGPETADELEPPGEGAAAPSGPDCFGASVWGTRSCTSAHGSAHPATGRRDFAAFATT